MTIKPAVEGARPASFLQSDFWAEFKASFGWRSLRFDLDSERGRLSLLVLIRGLRAGLSFAYVPFGPEIELPASERPAYLAELSEELRPFLPRSCVFIRYDPPWLGEDDRPILGPPLRRAASDVQVPDTVIVDLSPSEEDILARMKPKWRYNVRLAARKGVEVEEAGADSIGVFYSLYRETAARDRIALHPESYYRRLFDVARSRRDAGDADAPDLRLWIARADGAALASIVTLFRGGEAVYLYGASSDERRELMPAYALQWAAMRAAKDSGCERYDLFGIPPSDEPGHPMSGLYRFKTGFGGRIARRAGSWDYPLWRAPYEAFRGAELLRKWWYKDARKRLRGRKAG